MKNKLFLVTGASSGLGKCIAEVVLERGGKVALIARRSERLEHLAQQYPGRALPIAADMLKAADRERCVRDTIARFGGLDVLVNAAGRGSLGAAEEFSVEELREQLELNFVSCAELVRLSLPHLRQAGKGHIVNVSSIGGRVNVGGFSAYGAAKFALEGYSEALSDELKPLGIGVTVVEPGALRTEFAGDGNLRPKQHLEPYDKVLDPIRNYLYGSAGKQSGDPRRAAEVILQAIESLTPPLRLMLGQDAYGLWDAKLAATQEEMAKWRAAGTAIAFPGDQVKEIGS